MMVLNNPGHVCKTEYLLDAVVIKAWLCGARRGLPESVAEPRANMAGPKIEKDLNTLIEQSYSNKAVSRLGCAVPTYRVWLRH